jgi:glycosyltransferase involved in cell wall biosynthesis
VAVNDAPLLLDVTRLVWRRWVGRQPTGIDRVCLAYLEHFAPEAQAVVQHRRFRGILDRGASAALFELLRRPPRNFRAAFVSRALRHLRRIGSQGGGRLYLNLGHTGLDSGGFVDWLRTANVRPTYFVHDLIPITNPEFCRAGEAERHRSRMRTVLSTASGIIGNSRATLDELARFAAKEEFPLPPAVAAWLGISPLQSAEPAGAPERPTFVALGTIEARKNHLLLLRIWSNLIARMGSQAPRLLIIGQRGWEADEVFRMLDGHDELRGHVLELNGCPDEEVAAHLASARALLFPSRAEGYGLPMVEAMGFGVPVIASDLPVFREIGEGIPTLLDAGDEAAWKAAILEFAQPRSEARSRQIRSLKSYRAPTWDQHFQVTENWFATIGD